MSQPQPETTTVRARHPYPIHLSYSQAGAITDCGERFRLERGYGLRGVPSWALIGGKAVHSATEFLDVALEQARFPESVSLPAAVPAMEDDTPATLLSEKEHYVGELVAGQDALRRHLRDTAAKIVDIVRDDADAMAATVRELWRTALCYEVNAQMLSVLYEDPSPWLTVPDKDGWRAAGRASKEWPDKENYQWWQATGETMVADYLRWRETSGWTVAYLGATPAIELNLSADVGTVPVKGFADRCFLVPELGGVPVVVDLKGSKNTPSSIEQLCLYATLLEILGFPRPAYGTYWMARTGLMTDPYDLSGLGIDYFTWKYRSVLKLRDSGELQANQSSMWCKTCSVSDWCYAVGGSKAAEIPRPWQELAS